MQIRALGAVTFAAAAAAYSPLPAQHLLPARPRVGPLIACSEPPLANGHDHSHSSENIIKRGAVRHAAAVPSELEQQQAGVLLDALECWLRSQTIQNVLPAAQAKLLLADLRDDRRFWAQQRRQFTLLWTSVEAGMRAEDRPLAEVLGEDTTKRLIDALEEMQDDPAIVNAILRSEVVERLIGHVLYEGIFEFVQRADLLGNIFNTLPVLGAIRMQMLKTARAQLDNLLGDQIARFLGEYAAEAAEDAASYLLSEDTEHARRQAKRKAAEKLLSKPIGELVAISDLEMALVRDAVWSAVQEFRLPHESELVDRLYDEFGHQPFTILLPSEAAANRGDAPLFERGRGVLQDILGRFVISDEWRGWARSEHGAALLHTSATAPLRVKEEESESEGVKLPKKQPPPAKGREWDGWD